MKWLYEEIKKNQWVVTARSLIKSILNKNNWNVSKTSNILWCSRKTVRRAREWTLEDFSRAPLTTNKSKTNYDLENLILHERNVTKYWRIRLTKHLQLKYWIIFSSSTIWKIYKRNKVKKHVYSRKWWKSKPLYDYENIMPFEYWQVDTKHIEDFDALWELCFIPRKYKLPLYQWTYIDVKTRLKFIAYSYSLSSDFWLMFILTIVTFLRWMWIDYHMNFQADNWSEFCWGSKRKEESWNNIFNPLNCSFKSIPAWKKYLQGVVERSHRTDDEELYRPYLDRMTDINAFIYHASKYIHTYNCYRPSFGISMNWKSPIEKLKECNILHSCKFNDFPVFILENLAKAGGTYLKDHYHCKKTQ